MAWQDAVTEAGIAEGSKTTYQQLKPYEEAHIHVLRTDSGTTDPMYIGVYASVDDGPTESDTPLIVYAMEAADTKKDFGVSGPFKSIAIGIETVNAVDSSVATITIRRNGGP